MTCLRSSVLATASLALLAACSPAETPESTTEDLRHDADVYAAAVDHYAEAGAPKETGNTVHRIDPSIVIDEMQSAGFELAAKSDMLRSMHDDYSKVVFDPAVRGKTDRFVLRFVRPE